MRPPHLARSALGVRGVFASLFDQRPSPPKATRGRVRTPKVPAPAGRNTTGENLRKLATASSSCGELRKLSSIVVRVSRILCLSFRAKSRNLSILFSILPLGHSRTITAAWRGLFAALDLEHHALKRVLKNRWHWFGVPPLGGFSLGAA